MKSEHNQGERFDHHCVCCGKIGHEENTCRIPWDNIKGKKEQKE
jgi:hypothetical protein